MTVVETVSVAVSITETALQLSRKRFSVRGDGHPNRCISNANPSTAILLDVSITETTVGKVFAT